MCQPRRNLNRRKRAGSSLDPENKCIAGEVFVEVLRSENERTENEKREKEEKRKERERVLKRKEQRKGKKDWKKKPKKEREQITMSKKSQKPRKEQETEEYEEKKKGEWRGKGKLFLREVQQVVQQRRGLLWERVRLLQSVVSCEVHRSASPWWVGQLYLDYTCKNCELEGYPSHRTYQDLPMEQKH